MSALVDATNTIVHEEPESGERDASKTAEEEAAAAEETKDVESTAYAEGAKTSETSEESAKEAEVAAPASETEATTEIDATIDSVVEASRASGESATVEKNEAAEGETTTADAKVADEVATAEVATVVATTVEAATVEAEAAAGKTSEETTSEAATSEATTSEAATSEAATSEAKTVEATTTETVTTDADMTDAPVDENVKEASVEQDEKPEFTREEKEEKLKECLVNGKRFLVTCQYNKAVDVLAMAADFSGQIFGDQAEESYQPFFLYGQALLELAKMEDQVFNNAMSNMPSVAEEDETVNDSIDEEQYGNPEELTEEERAEIRQKVEEALAEEQRAEKAASAGTTESVAEVEKTTGEAVVPETENKAAEKETEAEAETKTEAEVDAVAEAEDVEMEDETEAGAEADADGEAEGNEENNEEDEESNMTLAWEILETARQICEKQVAKFSDADEEFKTWSLRKAEVLNVLGEHSIADNKFQQAQTDLKLALELQERFLEDTSRIIAQTNHNLAKAYRQNDDFAEAEVHFTKAQSILRAKSEKIKKEIETTEGEARAEREAELADLLSLIPELDAHIEDAKASSKQACEIREKLKADLESAASILSKFATAKDGQEQPEAKDITSLVRRPVKRAASSEPAEDAAKKTKSEEVATEEPEKVAESTDVTVEEMAPQAEDETAKNE